MIAHPAHLIRQVTEHGSGDEKARHQNEVGDGNEKGNTCQQPEESQPLQGAFKTVTLIEPDRLHLADGGFAIIVFDGYLSVFDIGHGERKFDFVAG